MLTFRIRIAGHAWTGLYPSCQAASAHAEALFPEATACAVICLGGAHAAR